jgi:hypothetical protein
LAIRARGHALPPSSTSRVPQLRWPVFNRPSLAGFARPPRLLLVLRLCCFSFAVASSSHPPPVSPHPGLLALSPLPFLLPFSSSLFSSPPESLPPSSFFPFGVRFPPLPHNRFIVGREGGGNGRHDSSLRVNLPGAGIREGIHRFTTEPVVVPAPAILLESCRVSCNYPTAPPSPFPTSPLLHNTPTARRCMTG